MTLISIVLEIFGKINLTAEIAPGIIAAITAITYPNSGILGVRKVLFHEPVEPSN